MHVEAARIAISIEPRNKYRGVGSPEKLALVTDRKWHSKGVRLTVGFLDSPPQDLQTRILLHMNAWAKTANVSFTPSSNSPQVRITRDPTGYWSYLGTDILSIPSGQATMNLQDFTMNTPESEFHRVVRHETGHTLGFPHEHMRKQLVSLLNRSKTITYFMSTQGWSRQEVIDQVLTPLDDKKLTETPLADQNSIMCYQIPGSLTKSGQPILGGVDIDDSDYAFAAKIYPK